MTILAFLFMSVAITAVTWLAVWCYLKVLANPGGTSGAKPRDD